MRTIWTTLGIARTADRATIRRAYAVKLKETNPEDDPEGFKALREAYETALQHVDAAARIPGIAVRQIEVAVPPQPEAKAQPDIVSEEMDTDRTAPQIADPTPSQDESRGVSTRLKSPADQTFVKARQGLEALLKPGVKCTDDARRDALKTLLACPALESIETRAETEVWLLRLLAFNIPRSDALLGIVRRHFGWNEDDADRLHRRNGDAPLKQRLFARERDIAYLALLANPHSPHHAAYRILSQPPKRETLWTRVFPGANSKELGDLLRDIRQKRPHLEAELNSEAVALLKKRAERPRLDGNNLLVALVALPALAVLAALTRLPEIDGDTMAMIAVALICPTAWTAGWFARVYLYVLPRRRWRQREGAPPWMVYGWGAALLGVFIVAAGPPRPWLAGIQLLLALVVAWWAMVVGEPDRRPAKIAWPIRLLVATGSLVVWWVFGMRGLPSAESKVMMTIALAAAAPAFGYGWMPLHDLWQSLQKDFRRKILTCLAVLCVTALLANWIVLPYPALQPLAFSFTAVALLSHKVPTLAGQHWSVGLSNRFIVVIVLVIFVMSSSWAWTAALGSLLLVRATINCVSAFAQLDNKPKKRPGLA